ncbi:MAG: type II toxin-antitoxin system VapC family toxin [Gammaproteobacteria bacterium]|nr:type II toxin-antitoxin system VapC family toxin [Gammaproteobacteria bacterium]
MLDTDTASYVLKGQSRQLDRRIVSVPVQRLCISDVTRGELLYGVRLKDGATRLAKVVDQFLLRVRSLPWDDAAADAFGSVAANLTKIGATIGTADAMIAAHAIAVDAVLVTNNTRHFGRVPGLRLENWTR